MKIYNKITILQLISDRVKISALVILTINLALIFGCVANIEITRKVRSPQYKIQSLSDLKIVGINIKDRKSVSELTNIEQSKLSEAIAAKKLPSSFTLNILAKNPNDGTGGTKKMSAILTGFDWRLLVDGKEIDTGNIKDEIEIITETIFPLKINLDLNKYFPELSEDSMMKFLFSLEDLLPGMVLKAKPIVETELGTLITDEIEIVYKEFR